MTNEKELSEGKEQPEKSASADTSADVTHEDTASAPSADVRDEAGKTEAASAGHDDEEKASGEVKAEATVEEGKEGTAEAPVAGVEPEAPGQPVEEEVVAAAEDEAIVEQPQGDGGEEKPLDDQDHHDEEEEHDDDDEHEAEDYSHYTPQQLLDKFTEVIHWDNLKKADRVVRELKAVHDELLAHDREEALKKFIADGGEEDAFEFRLDDLAYRFEENYKLFREKKHKLHLSLEQQKEENYKKKTEVLEKLRHLVDGEETTTSINALKKIQDEWKSIGQVPGKFAKTLWANYNALIDRFYDNRSIYFELKELDRKKNLESKLELCERAEALAKEENIKEAVKELNLLHDEFKHIGPVPKESQEELWQRFKAASDLIYAKRRDMVDELKVELKANMEVKLKLCEEAEQFLSFNSDRINEWNKKTKEILELQRKWEAVGGVPKEHAKKVNKRFWGAFKGFFSNKSAFFKTLEGKRHENLKLKEELVAKAEALQDSEQWESAANQLKQLQQQWREIGPVPEKVKETIFQKFKAACDHFFERKRAQSKGAEKEYYENLKKKEAICEEILKLAKEGNPDLDIVKAFQEQYAGIGFVPRNAIKTIQKKYQESLDELARSAENLPEDQRMKLKTAIQVSKLKSEPHSERKIHHKESQIKRQISTLENDIAVWKNNLEFLASSKKADKLKEDFDEKIAKAEEELEGLKQQLRVIYQTS